MRTLPVWFLMAGLVAVGLSAGPATAQDTAQITATAIEDADDCPGTSSFCWDVTGPTRVAPGQEVALTVIVPDEAASPHNLYLTFEADFDEGHRNSDGTAAEHQTEDLDPGDQETLTFTAPTEEGSIYYWCNVPGHEGLGMWGEIVVSTSPTDDNGGDTDDDEAASPGPGLIAALAGLALASMVAARRRG